jgi:cytochrome b6-f complex iron-sulfur subunit
MLTRAWLHVYTVGLAPDVGERRRAEVECDLWEQLNEQESSDPSAGSVLSRTARGALDDVTWRLFDARRMGARGSLMPPVGSRTMKRVRTDGLMLAAAGSAWLMTVSLLLWPQDHSPAFAGGLLALVALAGWTLEMRGDEEGQETAVSAWPMVLALAVTAIAGGLIVDSTGLGVAASGGLALVLTAVALRVRTTREPVAGIETMLSGTEIQRRIAGGDVLAVETVMARGVTRRAVLRGSLWLGLGSVLAMTGGVVVDFLWQRNVAGFGGVVFAGTLDQFPAGSKTKIQAGKFWLVNLTEEQGGPGFLALWQKCPHLGCTVPWLPAFSFNDKKGWFRCPCHQSTYNDAGVRVYGPAPRSMDRMKVVIDESGAVNVDTSAISKGSVDNATYAVQPPV